MLKYGLIAAGVVIAILGGTLIYKTKTLNNQIEILYTTINIKTLENNNLTLENTLYKKDINTLKENIEQQNQSIEKLALQKDQLQKTYNELKKQSTTEKLVNQKEIAKLIADGNKTDCNYGKDLNKAISGLKYEEL